MVTSGAEDDSVGIRWAVLLAGSTGYLNYRRKRSGRVPGVGLVHDPISLLPMLFPERHWKQACEVAPIFNELIDRVSLDGKFLQDSLSSTKKVDAFTSRLRDIHSKMLDGNKKEFVGSVKNQYYNQSQYDEIRGECSEFVYSYVGA